MWHLTECLACKHLLSLFVFILSGIVYISSHYMSIVRACLCMFDMFFYVDCYVSLFQLVVLCKFGKARRWKWLFWPHASTCLQHQCSGNNKLPSWKFRGADSKNQTTNWSFLDPYKICTFLLAPMSWPTNEWRLVHYNDNPCIVSTTSLQHEHNEHRTAKCLAFQTHKRVYIPTWSFVMPKKVSQTAFGPSNPTWKRSAYFYTYDTQMWCRADGSAPYQEHRRHACFLSSNGCMMSVGCRHNPQIYVLVRIFGR